MIDDYTFHVLSALATEKSNYEHSNSHYVSAQKLIQRMIRDNNSSDAKLEYYAFMAEYANFKVGHLRFKDVALASGTAGQVINDFILNRL